MKIGIITAMAFEQKQLINHLSDKTECWKAPFFYIEGRVKNNIFVLIQCGIGKVSAATGTVELIRNFQPDCIISTGVAGGIDTSLNVMDVVVGRETVYHDVWCGEGNAYGQVQGFPTFFLGDSTLYDCALSLHTETSIHGGLICTGDKFITGRNELDIIKRDFPDGLAVDMESAAIAQVCHLYKVPFISFRIISDTPGAVKHLEQYQNFWQEIADNSFRVTETFMKALPDRF